MRRVVPWLCRPFWRALRPHSGFGVVTVGRVAGRARHAECSWSPCYRDLGLPFECGTVQYRSITTGRPGRRFPSRWFDSPRPGPGARIGSLFFNPGRTRRVGRRLPARLRAGHSAAAAGSLRSHRLRPARHSTKHGGALLREPRQWAGFLTPFPFPVTAAEEAAWAAADQHLIGACDQRAARIIDHMSTADAARDLDLLREAVGDEFTSTVGYRVRLAPRRHLREPVPGSLPRAGCRRRPRPGGVGDGSAG